MATRFLPFIIASSFLLLLFSSSSQPYGINPDTLIKNRLECFYKPFPFIMIIIIIYFIEHREKVREMFKHAYDSYMTHAYPLDELQPLTCSGKDTWGRLDLQL